MNRRQSSPSKLVSPFARSSAKHADKKGIIAGASGCVAVAAAVALLTEYCCAGPPAAAAA